ncbi:MAG: alpha/beta hydrolase [Bdellovibrionaceae bacterium]|nr:alpha/beta hydrolase [Pseudobdellovibrionaceae bacterium]
MNTEINSSRVVTDNTPMSKHTYLPTQNGYCFGADGNKVYYELHGSKGPYVVLVYGVACLMNHWIYQTAELSKTHRVILFDYRGHHKSEYHPNLGMDHVAHDIKCLLDHLEVKQAYLAGHSFGVPVVVKFNQHYPDMSLGNVLINGFVYNPLDELFRVPVSKKLISSIETLQESAPQLSQWLWKKTVNNLLAQITCGVLGGFNLERTSFKDIEVYTQGLENLRLKTLLAYMKELVAMDLREALPEVQNKTLIISGLRDGITPTHQQDLMNALLPNSEIIKFPEGSHCTQLDLPDILNPILRDFFK